VGAALARSDLPLDGGLLPAGARPLALLRFLNPSDPLPLALLSGSFAFVREPFALVGKILAEVCDPLALIGDPVALVGYPLASGDRAFPLLERPLTVLVQCGALLGKGRLLSLEPLGPAGDLLAAASDLSPRVVTAPLEFGRPRLVVLRRARGGRELLRRPLLLRAYRVVGECFVFTRQWLRR